MKARIFGSIFGDEKRTKTLFQNETPLTRNRRQKFNPNKNNQTSDITIYIQRYLQDIILISD